jgi:hypothetical protein
MVSISMTQMTQMLLWGSAYKNRLLLYDLLISFQLQVTIMFTTFETHALHIQR